LVAHKELCVCQLMAVLGVSQPLISRNLGVLKAAGLLISRREKKLMFYRLRPDLSGTGLGFAKAILKTLEDSDKAAEDRLCLTECREFQKATGRCDMESLREFTRRRKLRAAVKAGGVPAVKTGKAAKSEARTEGAI
nr:metalloregulator ArsR/SmtB family transcription factor [Nitrospiraceae bacterium]